MIGSCIKGAERGANDTNNNNLYTPTTITKSMQNSLKVQMREVWILFLQL